MTRANQDKYRLIAKLDGSISIKEWSKIPGCFFCKHFTEDCRTGKHLLIIRVREIGKINICLGVIKKKK